MKNLKFNRSFRSKARKRFSTLTKRRKVMYFAEILPVCTSLCIICKFLRPIMLQLVGRCLLVFRLIFPEQFSTYFVIFSPNSASKEARFGIKNLSAKSPLFNNVRFLRMYTYSSKKTDIPLNAT